jgi:hypothetical protein
MALFTIPDPDSAKVAAESLGFLRNLVRETEFALDAAKARLESAEENYATNEDRWDYARAVNAATEALELAEATHGEALLKLHWELEGRYKDKAPKLPKAARVEPWKNDKNSWLACFKPRKNLS